MRFAARFIQRVARACLLGGLFASAATLALAQPAGAEGADPPGRVARLSDTSGTVWLQNPDSGEWLAAWRNQPLTSGDRLATDANGRAELRIGSTTLRLDGGGELEVLRLDDERITLQLHAGSLALRVRAKEAVRELSVLTAEGGFVPTRTGRYRVDRHSNGSTLTVYGGEARYEGPGSALTVYSNQRADFRLDGAGQAQYAIVEPVRDDFAAWTADRDRADDRADAERQRSLASHYVSPEMTGVEDLDRNGVWEQDAEYGALWIPRAVPVGWAPYAAGRWAWVRPWGWTWVDDAPWGFAPFHYGRWVSRRNVWCWAPGSYVARPVYAPALVGWVGGAGLNLSINIGRGPAVGWFPLAPREVFVPGYRVSPRYVREVNVTHVTNITNITTIVNNPQGAVAGIDYRNRHFPNALTMVPQSVLSQHQPVAPAALPWRGERGDGRGNDRGDERGNGRGDRGDRGRPEQIAADVVVAPPPLVRQGGNGPRAEPGRPAWPRGGMQRPDVQARNAGVPVVPVGPQAPQQQPLPQTQMPQQPLPAQAQQPPQQPFTRTPQPAVSAQPTAPFAAPRDPRGEGQRFDRGDDRRNERADDRREGRRDERREGDTAPRRDDRRAMPVMPVMPAAPVTAPAAAPIQTPAPAPQQPVREPVMRPPAEPSRGGPGGGNGNGGFRPGGEQRPAREPVAPAAPAAVPQQPQPAPRVEAQPQRQPGQGDERRSFERRDRERERER